MVDPRGPRFAAALTTVVFVIVLLTGSGWLAAAQAVVFGLTALAPRLGPYSLIYRSLIAPRLAKPTELEPGSPLRFAQALGFVFAVFAAAGFLSGAPVVGYVAAAFALAAAFLNAAFGLCLGCELYLAYRRMLGKPIPRRVQQISTSGEYV